MILGAATVCCLLAVCGPTADGPAVERVELLHGYYWLATPAGMDPQTRYPLVVCLHGTETRAADLMGFWLSLEADLPLIFVAPQATDAGWRDTDLTLLAELTEHIAQTVPYDPERVLLTGHSAGGAMAFHLLYVEDFPATAVAVTANYLPPTVTAEMIERRRDVPLFYAVGEADLNRAARHVGAIHRDQNAAVPVFHRFVPPRACINHSERALEPARDQGQIFAETALRIAGIGNAHNKKVVPLAGFIGHGLRPFRGPAGDDVGLPRRLLVRLSFERGRCFGGAFDCRFGTSAIRLFAR